MMRSEPNNPEYWCKPSCRGAKMIVDASDYFRSFFEQATTAVSHIYLAGWQFNSNVELLRGPEAVRASYPTNLLPFLEALCTERPDLRVYILAWDYNFVFALEREWLQDIVFQINSPSNLRFCFDGKHALGASHHQKLVSIDGRVAFTGGIDLASGRWDNCRHRAQNPLRQEDGEPQKPYHDVMVAICGDAVRHLERLFRERWRTATGEHLAEQLPTPGRSPEIPGIAIEAGNVMISRTVHALEGEGNITEILSLYTRSIREARELVYIETQYLTSREIHDVLAGRMQDPECTGLQIVVLMPDGADTAKESFALGNAQERILRSLEQTAAHNGCVFRAYTSLPEGGDAAAATFIHSKILIVDDRLLAIGSANLTNRSMQLDTELCLAFEAEMEHSPLAASIVNIRTQLLGEHSGLASQSDVFRKQGLVQRLDELVATCSCRLRHRPAREELLETDPLIRLEHLFDPEKPLSDIEFSELFNLQSVAE